MRDISKKLNDRFYRGYLLYTALETELLFYVVCDVMFLTAALFESTYDFHFGVKINGAGGGGYMLGFTDDRDKAASLLSNYDVIWLNAGEQL